MLCFYSEQVFYKWNQFSHNKGMKFCVISCFESLDLRCEMTIMSRDRVLGRDNIYNSCFNTYKRKYYK